MAATETLIESDETREHLNWGTKAVRHALSDGGSSRKLPFMKTATLSETLTLTEACNGLLRLSWHASEALNSYDGIIQGGMLAVVADIAQGHTFSTTLDGPAGFSTVDLATKYLRPVASGQTYAVDSRVIDRSRRSAMIETFIRRADGKVTTHFLGSWQVSQRNFELKS
jgi:acyl-coenzyme A thioesterase PaaI-like protein